jgi:hypothetical protein
MAPRAAAPRPERLVHAPEERLHGTIVRDEVDLDRMRPKGLDIERPPFAAEAREDAAELSKRFWSVPPTTLPGVASIRGSPSAGASAGRPTTR